MKKLAFLYSLFIISSLILLGSCQNQSGSSKIKDSDTLKVFAWNKLIIGDSIVSHKIVETRKPYDQPVNYNDAETCIERYQMVYKDPAKYVDIIQKAYTEGMVFGSYNLSVWLSSLKGVTNATQIKITLGLYTGNLVSQLGVTQDKLTAFLCPLDGSGNPAKYIVATTKSTGDPAAVGDNVDPYDLAGLKP